MKTDYPRRMAPRRVRLAWDKLNRPLVAALLLLCAIIPFTPNIAGYFLADDLILLRWTQGKSVQEAVSFFDPNTFWFYRPGVKTYFWLMQALFGLNSTPYHLVSLALHLLAGYLLYLLLRRWGRASRLAGIIAGAVFLLNPHGAETVSWIAATGDLIAAICVLLALLTFYYSMQKSSPLAAVASAGLFTIGLFTRETALLLPGLLLLAIVLLPRPPQAPLRSTLIRLSPYMLIALGYLIIESGGRLTSVPATSRGGLHLQPLHPDSVLLGVLDYVHGLLPGGSYIAALPFAALRTVMWLEWLLLIIFAFFLWRAGQKLLLFGLAWLLVTPLLFVFFSQPTDRYFYLPALGYAILVGAGLSAALSIVNQARPLVPAVARMTGGAILVVVLGSQLFTLRERLSAWQSASQTAGAVFAALHQAQPDPPAYTSFYFVGLPAVLNGIPVFQDVVPQIAPVLYRNQTLSSRAITCADLKQRAEFGSRSLFFQFDGKDIRQLKDKNRCDFPDSTRLPGNGPLVTIDGNADGLNDMMRDR